MTIQLLANRMALKLKRKIPDHPISAEVMAYSIVFFLNTLLTIVVSMTISLFFNNMTDVLIVLISFPILRMISGGYHFRSGWTCIIVSAVGVNAIALIELNNEMFGAMTGVTVLLLLLFAPSRIEQQTRIPSKFFPYLKLGSIVIVSLNLFIQSDPIACAFFVQALTLITPLKRKG